MSFFVLRYDRGEEPDIERFDDETEAFRRLRILERQLLRDLHDSEGVVLLVAKDEEDLRTTHPQYFKSFDELREEVEA